MVLGGNVWIISFRSREGQSLRNRQLAHSHHSESEVSLMCTLTKYSKVSHEIYE